MRSHRPDEPLPETVEGEIVGGNGQLPLVEWLSMVYRRARRITGGQSRQGRQYGIAQQIAIGHLARKLRTSARATRSILEDRADLRAVLGLDVVPSRSWFHAASSVERRAA